MESDLSAFDYEWNDLFERFKVPKTMLGARIAIEYINLRELSDFWRDNCAKENWRKAKEWGDRIWDQVEYLRRDIIRARELNPENGLRREYKAISFMAIQLDFYAGAWKDLPSERASIINSEEDVYRETIGLLFD